MTPRSFYDNRNRPVALGTELGRGGEGSVFVVVGQPSCVAKVYHQPPDASKEQKLKAMAALARPDLLSVAAWPTATLHETPGGRLWGVLMPLVSGHKEVHTLYSPAHRKKEFPTADWAFLIQAAMNCAIAFDAIHRGGHCIGDVNQSNVLVSPKATARLIDCDSYQITANGKTFPCEVGVPLYTPPELQGRTFRGVVRTPNHDRFGLAVLIFHLLFAGRHPFSGRPLTRGDLPIEKAIEGCRFAYSRAAAQLQIAPPPHAPLLGIVPDEVARLFERAFSVHSTQPGARPAAQEWAVALSNLRNRLKACPRDAGHQFSAHVGQCYWCDLMKSGAPNYFISVAVFRMGTATPSLSFVLGAAWAEIDRVPRPNTAYQRPPVPLSSRIVPTALPPHVPSRVPPPIAVARVPPPIPSLVPPPVVIPREFLLKAVAWTAAVSAGLLSVVLCFAFVVFAAASASRSSPRGGIGALVAVGSFAAISTFVFGVGWLFLELKHRAAVRSANAEREEALEDMRREEARREAEYEEAFRKANAKREAILDDMRREKARRSRAYWDARHELERAENELCAAAREYERSFDEAKRVLERLKNDFLGLKQRYEQEYRELERNKEAAQRAQFLQTQFISDHKILGIGDTREAVLRSNGIETAYDIDRDQILAINGFGQKLTDNLLAWKEQVSRQFRFNAAAAVSPGEVAALVVKYKQLQERIEVEMKARLAELRLCSERAGFRLPQFYARIPGLVARLAQAEADAQVLSGEEI
jgi:DNA-binding helix-hairpin-helix protein with protein kinase domain